MSVRAGPAMADGGVGPRAQHTGHAHAGRGESGSQLSSSLLLHVEIQIVTACWNPVCYCMLESSLLSTAG